MSLVQVLCEKGKIDEINAIRTAKISMDGKGRVFDNIFSERL